MEHLPDAAVSPEDDRRLIALLSTCFTKPIDEPFRRRRYLHECPAQRFVIRGSERDIVAHIALHDKRLSIGGDTYRIGGVAEVCVREEQRGRGLMRRLLGAAHRWLEREGVPFALLFGEAGIYASSGYLPIRNSIKRLDPGTSRWLEGPIAYAMARPLAGESWPEGTVDLGGPEF